MTVHLPVRHSHCARASFTVLVSCCNLLLRQLLSENETCTTTCLLSIVLV